MLIIVLVVLGLAAAVLVAVVAMQPSSFQVSRSAVVAAAPADVFARVQDLHQWEAWSPWEKIDPAMKRVYEGPQTGTGAVYRWAGNGKVGQGSMTITDTTPNQLVRLRLDFLKPFKGTNIAEFVLKPDGERTLVTWMMSGKCAFVAKAIHLFCNMDKMIGGQFEKGLANLNLVASSGHAGSPS